MKKKFLVSEPRMVWKIIFGLARSGEICCGLIDVPMPRVRAALLACVQAGVLTEEEFKSAGFGRFNG